MSLISIISPLSRDNTLSSNMDIQKGQATASTLAVACPYCMSMFEDSVLSLDKGDTIDIKDIAELVQEAI